MAVIGLTKDNSQAFLLDYWVGRIDFPTQLEKIQEWHQQWRPEMIGIEANAFQRALAQMSWRMEGLPPVVPVYSKGDKNERILAMSPLFKIGRVRVARRMQEFIEQWISFNPATKNQDDDLLDAVEIALGTAGVLLPRAPFAASIDDGLFRQKSVEDEARSMIRSLDKKRKLPQFDPELGTEF
jgi:predicted phage terminase large subunit-like protein